MVPVTMRMVRAAQREAQTYDRNRESLFDLRDPALRAHIHMLFARLIIALDGALDAHREIAQAESTMRMLGPTDSSLPEFAKIREFYAQDRKQSFDFVVELTDEIAPLLAKLRPRREILLRSPRSRRARHGGAASHGRISGIPDSVLTQWPRWFRSGRCGTADAQRKRNFHKETVRR